MIQKKITGIKVKAKIDNATVEEALQQILSKTDLLYEIDSNEVIRVYGASSEAEFLDLRDFEISYGINISGTVRDKDTGESLPYATVLVQGTSNGATTNLDGLFTLFDIPSDTSRLVVSYLGYRDQLVKLLPNMDMNDLELSMSSGSVQLQEVTISANKSEQLLKASTGISKMAMTPEVASILPSYGEKDIFRSLQLLPGISGTNESSSGLFIRGGTPDQNLILFDGFTVYHVDHLYGFFSAFNSNAIKDVQLYKGAYEAKYGGRLSSVVEMTGKDGNSQSFNMGVGLSLLSFNAFVESPFADGKGSFIITGRRSFQSNFYSNLFDSFSNIGGDNTGQPEPGRFGFGQTESQPNSYFYDLNAKITYRFTAKDKLSISLYNGEDDLDNSRLTDSNNLTGFGPFGGGGTTQNQPSFLIDNIDLSNWGNIGGSVKWSRQWTDQLFSNTVVSYSNYFSDRDRNNRQTITRSDTTITRVTGSIESNDVKDFTFKIDNEYRLNNVNQLYFGLQLTHNDIDYTFNQNDTISLVDRMNSGLTASIYVQDKVTLNDRLIMNAGLRANYFSPTASYHIEPRLSATYLVSDQLKLKAAYGQYNQFATRVVREDIQQGSRDFWTLADGENIPVSQSTHYILGTSYETRSFLFDIEAFYKDYDGLTEYTSRQERVGFGPDATLTVSDQFYTGTGIAKGIEFLAQKKFGKLNGWIGYTLSSVDYNFEVFGEESFAANQDQLHEFKAVATYKLGRFDLSTTFVYGTGRPYTAPVGYYDLELLDGSSESYFEISEKNTLRFPSYHRWDAAINYDIDFGESKGTLGLSFFNIYNRQNTWYKEYDVVEGQLIETDINLLGFTPSIFFNWTLK